MSQGGRGIRVWVEQMDEAVVAEDTPDERLPLEDIVDGYNTSGEKRTLCQCFQQFWQLCVAVVRFFYHYFTETYPDYKYIETHKPPQDVPQTPGKIEEDASTKISSQLTINIDEITVSNLNKHDEPHWRGNGRSLSDNTYFSYYYGHKHCEIAGARLVLHYQQLR